MKHFFYLPLAALAVLGFVSCEGCQDDELDRLRPVLEFEPASLDFGPRAIGQEHLLSTQAFSRGSLDLTISDVRIEPADAPFLVQVYPDFLARGDQGDVSVTFSPGARGDYTARAIFTINDEQNPEVALPLTGSVGPPMIEVNPEAIDFGPVNEDVGATQAVRITNVGGDWLQISALEFVESTQAYRIGVATELQPGDSLEPGAYALVHIGFVPTVSGIDTNSLRIISNADNGPETLVPLSADGNLAPVVVAYEQQSGQSELRVDPDDDLTLDSIGTYDPEGEALTLYWQIIEKPVGSQASLPNDMRSTPQTQIEPGLVGDYRVRLLATDPQGAQGVSDVVIHAIRDVVVQLRWQTATDALCQAYSDEACAAMDSTERQSLCCGQTDIDLHLLAPGGSVGDYLGSCPSESGCDDAKCACEDSNIPACLTCVSKGRDCAYANRHPDWGILSDPLDNPSLDIDDVRGKGPEVISLNGPVDGDYQVEVHYCNDRIGEPTEAFVDIFIQGELRWSLGPQRLDSQGLLWQAAILSKNGETWTGLTPGLVAPATDPDLCAK